jgi:hypothetical protein
MLRKIRSLLGHNQTHIYVIKLNCDYELSVIYIFLQYFQCSTPGDISLNLAPKKTARLLPHIALTYYCI